MIEELKSDAGGREPRSHQRQPQASATQGPGVVWLSPQPDPGLGLPGGPWGTQGELSAHTAPPSRGRGGKEPGLSLLLPAPPTGTSQGGGSPGNDSDSIYSGPVSRCLTVCQPRSPTPPRVALPESCPASRYRLCFIGVTVMRRR